MGISPFMAFARGAFQGYNEIQRSAREQMQAKDLEKYKQNIKPDDTRYFQAMGSHGPVNLFALDDAGDFSDEELFDKDMARIGENLTNSNRFYTDQFGLIRAIDEDPVLSANVDKQVHGYMRRWMKANTVEKGSENNKYTELPYDYQNAYFHNHDYYGAVWSDLVEDGIIESLDMANQPPNTVPVISVDKNNNVNGSAVTYNNTTIGMVYDVDSQSMINMDQNVFNKVLVPKLNSIKGQKLSAGDYTVQYGTNAIRLHTAPILVDDMQSNDYLQNRFAGILKPNEPVTYGLIMQSFVKSRVVDPKMINIFNKSLENYNEKVQDEYKIGVTDIYQAFKLASPNKMTRHGTSGRQEFNDAKSFIENTFRVDLEKLSIRAEAGGDVVKTVVYMKNNVKDFEDKNGFFPPISALLQGPVSFISGVRGTGGLVAQSVSFFNSVGDRYDLKKDGKILNKLKEYSAAAEKETENDAILSAASTTARHRYYKYMLAYQLAVAIQGGTGGRTVSDQDVENMLNAIGDTLFANGRVQLSVLDTIESFAQDIVDKNQFWQNANMDISSAYAADAMDRFMYGGVSVNTEVGTARTEYAGAKLRDKISQISPDQYEEEMSGLKDPILNDMLIEKNIIQEGEIVSYERGKDFALNLEHHMRAGDLLTYPEYQILVDRHYTGNRQAQDIYKTKESFENYVIQHEALNK